MARIITYEDDPNISDLDRLIGSDGNDYNITKNFTLLGIAEYVIDVFVNPDATDFHIPVFNSNGTRITDSIMHQDSSPSNGVAGTIITVDGNFSVIKDTTLGVTINDTTIIPSTLRLRGKVSDKNDNFGVANQILTSDENGYVQWGPECGQGFILGQGTLHYLPLWTPDSGTIGDSLVYQNGDNDTPATEIYFKGGLASEGSKVANITDIALGNKNFAGGEGSAAFNFRTSALGNDSFAAGHRSIAGGHGSLAAGYDAGAGNYGFGFWTADATGTTLELKLVSGSINAGDFIVANVEADTSIKHEILTATPGLGAQDYTITIAQSITVNVDASVAIEEAIPDRGDGLGAIALGHGAVSKGSGSVAIGRKANADAVNQIAIGSASSTVKLDGTAQDDTQDKVLVIDANTNIVKYRSALTISPELGWDTLSMVPDGWASTEGYYNAYVNLDDSTTASKNIKDMTWLKDGDRVVVIAENTKPGSSGPLADGAIGFPTWTNVAEDGTNVSVESFGSWVGTGSNFGYPTATLQFGEKLKFKAEYYVDGANTQAAQLNWDACCKILSKNICPVVNSISFSTDEDTPFSGVLVSSDDGYGSYGVTYAMVSAPSNGAVVLNAATGAYTYTPNANYNGADEFTYQAYDGYCYSNIGVVTVIVNNIAEPPVWTSQDPVASGSWTNINNGDVLPPYNWTVDDPDHTCAELSYSYSVTDSNGAAATWLTFTPNTPADCGGTLSGTYPAGGGVYSVTLNVTDPDGQTTAQSFQIAGLVPDNDTFLTFWLDGSGSMDDTAEAVSAASSQTQTISRVVNNSSGQSLLLSENPAIPPTNYGYYINDIDHADEIFGGCWSVTAGMEIYTLASAGATPQPTGLTVTSATNTSATTVTVAMSGALSVSIDDLLVFRKTAASQTADYNNTDSLRNLLQDFYATAGVEGSPDFNTDPATNGAERFNSHVKFGWMYGDGNGENQVVGMSNYGRQATLSDWQTALATGGDFENASSVVSFAFGDETDGWYASPGGIVPYNSVTSVGGARLLADVATVQTWLANGQTAGTQARSVLMAVTQNHVHAIAGGLESGVTNTNFTSPWTDNNLKITPTTPNPPQAVFLGSQFDTGAPNGLSAANPNSNPPIGGQYFKNQIQRALQQLGFTNI